MEEDGSFGPWPEERGMPVVYLGREGTRFRYRITILGQSVIASLPPHLVDRRWPDTIDGTAVASGDEGMSPAVFVSEGKATLGEFSEYAIPREREKKSPMAAAADQIFGNRTIA